jgi:hypothetical protein
MVKSVPRTLEVTVPPAVFCEASIPPLMRDMPIKAFEVLSQGGRALILGESPVITINDDFIHRQTRSGMAGRP